jgi:hypothetical protein
VDERDFSALIGVLSMLEGELMLDQLPDFLVDHLSRRFARDGLLPHDATPDQLRQALHDLNMRLRAEFEG